jgi:hypothetical protein
MPRMLHRDPCDITVTHARDFSYLFDCAHFKSSMEAACPMMTIYDDFARRIAWLYNRTPP